MSEFSPGSRRLDVRVTARHFEVSDDVRSHVVSRAERLLRRFDGVHNVEVILSMEGGKPKAEMIVGVVRGQRCVAAADHEDVLGAVDVVVDKIDRQIRKLKGRLRERHT